MPIQSSYNREVALISASELPGLLETCHLMRSPKNAERLLAAYERAMKGEGEPQSMESLKTNRNTALRVFELVDAMVAKKSDT